MLSRFEAFSLKGVYSYLEKYVPDIQVFVLPRIFIIRLFLKSSCQQHGIKNLRTFLTEANFSKKTDDANKQS